VVPGDGRSFAALSAYLRLSRLSYCAHRAVLRRCARARPVPAVTEAGMRRIFPHSLRARSGACPGAPATRCAHLWPALAAAGIVCWCADFMGHASPETHGKIPCTSADPRRRVHSSTQGIRGECGGQRRWTPRRCAAQPIDRPAYAARLHGVALCSVRSRGGRSASAAS